MQRKAGWKLGKRSFPVISQVLHNLLYEKNAISSSTIWRKMNKKLLSAGVLPNVAKLKRVALAHLVYKRVVCC